MTSLIKSLPASQNELPPLPTQDEWQHFVSYHAEKIKTCSSLYPHTKIMSLRNTSLFRDILMNYQGMKPSTDFHTKGFEYFSSTAMLASSGFIEDLPPPFKEVSSTFDEVNQKIPKLKEEAEAYKKRVLPFLKTLHKVIVAYIDLMKKISIGTLGNDFGIIPAPNANFSMLYIRNESLLYAFANPNESTKQYNIHHLPLYHYLGDIPVQKTIVADKENELYKGSGYVIQVRNPGIVELIAVIGSEWGTTFSTFPFAAGTLTSHPNHPTCQFITLLVPLEELVPRYHEFFPFPSDPVSQNLSTILLLEELVSDCDDKELKAEAIQMIAEIENDLVDHYKIEIEEKIRIEQEKRKELVISGKIESINRTTKNKHGKKKEEKKIAEVPNPETKKEMATPHDPVKLAKLNLLCEKNRIKKHQFISFISRVKVKFKKDFKNLLTQHGSHLTFHGEEKESITVVIPHKLKKDSTVSGKLLNRFVSRVQEFFFKQ